jgi:hypothetical protein
VPCSRSSYSCCIRSMRALTSPSCPSISSNWSSLALHNGAAAFTASLIPHHLCSEKMVRSSKSQRLEGVCPIQSRALVNESSLSGSCGAPWHALLLLSEAPLSLPVLGAKVVLLAAFPPFAAAGPSATAGALLAGWLARVCARVCCRRSQARAQAACTCSIMTHLCTLPVSALRQKSQMTACGRAAYPMFQYRPTSTKKGLQ